MLRRLLLSILILTGSGLAQQQWGRMEGNVDYGYLRLKVPNATKPVNMNGVQLGFGTNVNRWLGFGAEFGAYYHCVAGCTGYTDIAHNDAFLFLAGPRVRLRPGKKWQPFLQGSAGAMKTSYDDEFDLAPSPTGVGVVNASKQGRSGLAYSAGGGLDWVMGRGIFRVAQLDMVRYEVGGRPASTVRFSMGFRYQWGMRK